LNKANDLKQGKYKAPPGEGLGAAAALPKTIFRGSDEAMEQLKKFIRSIFEKYENLPFLKFYLIFNFFFKFANDI
jgi:hypothetical protein